MKTLNLIISILLIVYGSANMNLTDKSGFIFVIILGMLIFGFWYSSMFKTLKK